jgi:hypothetical protein
VSAIAWRLPASKSSQERPGTEPTRIPLALRNGGRFAASCTTRRCSPGRIPKRARSQAAMPPSGPTTISKPGSLARRPSGRRRGLGPRTKIGISKELFQHNIDALSEYDAAVQPFELVYEAYLAMSDREAVQGSPSGRTPGLSLAEQPLAVRMILRSGDGRRGASNQDAREIWSVPQLGTPAKRVGQLALIRMPLRTSGRAVGKLAR